MLRFKDREIASGRKKITKDLEKKMFNFSYNPCQLTDTI